MDKFFKAYQAKGFGGLLCMTFSAILALGASTVEGATEWQYGMTVEQIHTSDLYGTCGVKLSGNTTLAGCTYRNYVTMDCDGTYEGQKSKASLKLSTAQLAYATGDLVDVWFSDEYVVNGVCFAKHINIRKAPAN